MSYLVDQLHWFRARQHSILGRLGRRVLSDERVIQGTILARRAVMPPYPDIGRGEDTLQTHALFRAEASNAFRVSRLRGMGWCYIYRFHGGNAWDAAHHRAISASSAPARSSAPRPVTGSSEGLSPQLPSMRTPLGDQDRIRYPRRLRPRLTGPKRNEAQAAFLRRNSPAALASAVKSAGRALGRPNPIIAGSLAQSRPSSRNRHNIFASKHIVLRAFPARHYVKQLPRHLILRPPC